MKCDDYLGDHANALKRGREGAQVAETRMHASEQIGGVGGGSGRGLQQTVPEAGVATARQAIIEQITHEGETKNACDARDERNFIVSNRDKRRKNRY